VTESPHRRAHESGWQKQGRRRWDLPPNLTKCLLAAIPVLGAALAHAYM
jgi:hypothetical protein